MNNNSNITTLKQNEEYIKKQFFPENTNKKDMEFCLKVAQTLGLNPIKREIFFIERRAQINGQWLTKIEPLTSRDGFLSIAHRTGYFAGIESYCEVRETPRFINGQWQNTTDLVATAKVWRKDSSRATTVEVEFAEYAQVKRDGSLTQFWAKMPKTMLKKVAESQSLRKAFNISGIYGVEEMGIGHVSNDELKIDSEAIEAQIEETGLSQAVSSAEEIKSAVKQLGLQIEEKAGWLGVKGNTFPHTKLLKTLGFKFFNDKKIWAKKVVA